ncbi:hypothetical protein TEA_002299 [Camellia sinensis var. sinensis]|uniref:Uncharacterized protein n=1 Tax=Camellia sinensis var. sinensis TaxID=542762 RepID=A0A4S4EUQ9_CAMSN|nr:hypothetical protein TEA_002299 [Camellia sinensis var. sinensis]
MKMDERRVLSLRNVLMVSLALNVGLILRIGYVGESWRRSEQSFSGLCLEKKQENRGASMADSSLKVVHVSERNHVSSSSTSSTARTEFEDAGESVINLEHGSGFELPKFFGPGVLTLLLTGTSGTVENPYALGVCVFQYFAVVIPVVSFVVQVLNYQSFYGPGGPDVCCCVVSLVEGGFECLL